MSEQTLKTDVTRLSSVSPKIGAAVFFIGIGIATAAWVGLIGWFSLTLLGF
jgi:hypothetical protein